MQLEARKRVSAGTGNGRLRREGRLPGIVYGHRVDSIAVEVDTREFDRVLARAGRTQLIDLVVEGGRPRKVLVKEVQRSPRYHSLLHVDFHQVSLRERLQVDVPLSVVGEAELVKVGLADVLQIAQALRVECLPTDIPEQIELDVSALDRIDAGIQVKDLTLARGVTAVADPEDVLVKLVMRRAAEVEEAAPAAEEVGAAAPAPAEESGQG